MPDLQFAHPRLAAIYDDLDAGRRDLEHYAAIADEFSARRVLDVGCGTGTFACLLADRGLEVIGVDPAAASLDVARCKPGADRVDWVLGDTTGCARVQVDLVTMTGNVAQVFVDDAAWASTLGAARSALAPGGHLVFETRDPARRAWLDWTRDESWSQIVIDEIGAVESWVEVVEVTPPLVTFRAYFHFVEAGDTMISSSTLRFRERVEIDATLANAGFRVREVREAPDRPGKEFVVIATPADGEAR